VKQKPDAIQQKNLSVFQKILHNKQKSLPKDYFAVFPRKKFNFVCVALFLLGSDIVPRKIQTVVFVPIWLKT